MKPLLLLATSCVAVSVGLSSAMAAATPVTTTASSKTGEPGANGAGPMGQDYAKLSIDGARALQDVDLARLAIFDGKPAIATKLVSDAQQAMSRAKTDHTSMMKAEADLKKTKTTSATDATASTTKIAWLPVDGELTLDENLTPSTPEKAAALADANDHLHRGEPDKAGEALKVASITADYTLALAPMNQSADDISQAVTMMNNKNYYGASQALHHLQDGIRYDTIVSHDTAPASAAAQFSAPAPAPAKNG